MVTLKQLKRVAKEFNEVMDGLDPLIDLTVSETELKVTVKEAIKWIDWDTDVFTEETKEIIDELTGTPSPKQKTAEKIHEKNIGNKPVQTAKDVEGVTDDGLEPLTPSGRKQIPIPVKNEKKELFAKKSSTSAERISFITPFIQKGKYTKTELVTKMSEKFPDLAVSSIQTLLTDAKNPKYNKFAKLVVQNDKGVLSFKEE